MNHAALTHHCIDDLPAWDQAMDTMRMHFPFAPGRLNVSDDGKRMTYRMKGMIGVETYLQTARLTIMMHRLPLRVERDTFVIGNLVLEDNMIITYIGR